LSQLTSVLDITCDAITKLDKKYQHKGLISVVRDARGAFIR